MLEEEQVKAKQQDFEASFLDKVSQKQMAQLERAKQRGSKYVIQDLAAHEQKKKQIKDENEELEQLLALKPRELKLQKW